MSLLLSMMFFVLPAKANPLDCIPVFMAIKDLAEVFNNECTSKTSQTDKCKCLKQARQDNEFINGAFKDNTKIKEYQTLIKKQYTEHFLDTYKAMNYGASYQAEILGIENSNKLGCTAADINQKFIKVVKADSSKRKAAITNKDLTFLEKDVKDCLSQPSKFNDPCETLEEELEEKKRLKLTRVKSLVQQQCGAASLQIKQVNDDSADGDSADAGAEERAHQKSVTAKLNRLKEEKSWVELKIKRLQSSKSADVHAQQQLKESLVELTALIEKWEKTPAKDFGCGDDLSMQFADIDLKVGNLMKQEKQTLAHQGPSDSTDTLKKALEESDDIIKKELERQHTTAPEHCYSFAQFQAIESQPQDLVWESFLKNDNADLLNPLKVTSPPILNAQRNEFLLKNPILAKIASNSQLRPQLNLRLHDLAMKVRGKSDDQKRDQYLDFLKTGISDLNKINQTNELYLCQQLSEGLAAITLGRDLPLLPLKQNDPMNKFFDDVLTCKIVSKNSRVKENTHASLKANPLFAINCEQDQVPDDTRYKKFNANNCKGFAEFRKNCKGDDKSCRSAFTQGKVKVAEMTSDRLKNANLVTDESVQNHAAKKHFEEKVMPKFKSRSIFAERGKEEEFFDLKDQDATIAANSELPASMQNNGTMPARAPQIAEPDWSVNASKSVSQASISEVARSGQIPENLLPVNYPSMPIVQQAQALKSLKNQLKDEGSKIVDGIADDSERIKARADLSRALAQVDEKVRELSQVTQSKNPGQATAVSNNQSASVAGISGNVSANSNAQNMNRVNLPNLKNGLTQDEARSKALLETKYKVSEQQLANGVARGPASAPDDFKIMVAGALTVPLSKDSQLLGSFPLAASEFNNKAVIGEKIQAELKSRNIPHGEEVLFKFFDHEKNQVLIVNVSWARDQWVVKYVPRSALLDNLKLTLASESRP